MLKRQFQSIYLENQKIGYEPGDQAAHRAAAALADRADAPTIGALMDALTLLERVGGQFHLTALRLEVEGTEEYETCGVGFNYQTKDARLKAGKSPDEILGVPITDAEDPPTEVEIEVPPMDPDLRDETEADPDADPLPEDPSEESRERVRRDAELAAQEA